MSRVTGLVLWAVLVVMVGQDTRAQMPAGPGGFGFEYAQPVPSNSVLLDRWWMPVETPAASTTLPPAGAVETAPAVQATNPGRAARTARGVRSFSRVSNRRFARFEAQPATSLPTGSLYWPGAAGVSFYSPAQRYAGYGQGYGVSPYGSADYGANYKGFYWGY
jgi:hypothetical protein